jgi:hypothetical protein
VRKAIAAVSALFGVAFFAIRPLPDHPPLPKETPALAERIAAHPTDWLAASALADRALDAPVRNPTALWHASGALAIALAPALPAPRASMARAGFFHWGELSEAEQKALLEAYAPALRDPVTFDRMYQVIFGLTGDLDYLRRAAPQTPGAMHALAWLAGTYGHYDQYRVLRDELEKADATRPAPPAYGPDAWSGTCGENVCASAWRAIDARQAIVLDIKTIDSDDVDPYVEIYVDGARRTEGPVDEQQRFTALVDALGTHRVEVRLANPITRNSQARRVRIIALQAS